MDAEETIQDTRVYVETTKTPLCILSLDFQQAFDKISHQYLYQILLRYGISSWFVDRIKALYENATASIQLNGVSTGQIPIQWAVRQRFPLSVVLYTLCIHPLLSMLNDSLRGIGTGRHSKGTKVLAYADDVTVFITNQTEFEKVKHAIHIYEKATGAN
jgi:hypothetical protein